MPRVPIDYSQTHFYKFVCRNTDIKDCYVGHTTDFTKRKNRHKSDCCNQKSKHHNVPLYQFIRDNGNWDKWQMILIDTLHCENSLDALKKEREYIEELQAKLNNRKKEVKNIWTFWTSCYRKRSRFPPNVTQRSLKQEAALRALKRIEASTLNVY